MRTKPTIGRTLYMLDIGNAARNTEQKLTSVIVTSIGKKYFTVKEDKDSWIEVKFHLEDWSQNTGGYPRSYCLYESEQEYLDEIESEKLRRQIRSAFEYSWKTKSIPLQDLRRIVEIIEKT